MPLSQAQIDYVTQTTNTRGAAFEPAYSYVSTMAGGSAGHEWLFIQVHTAAGDPGSSKKGPRGWLTDQGEFELLVQDVLGQIERAIRH